MDQTVYLDLFFLINLSMDFLGLLLTAKLLSRRLSVKRAIMASVFGGVYACVSLVLLLEGIVGLLADIFACGVMGIIAVPKRKFREILFFSVVYSAVSILLGGFMTVAFTIFNKIGLDKLFGYDEGGGISVWLFALLALISGVVSLVGGNIFKKNSSRREGEVCISYGGKSVLLHALVDSGNFLKEPISGKKCIVADIDSIKEIFPRGTDRSNWQSNDALAERIRVIPVSSVNGKGMLYAFRPDSVRVNMGKGWCETDVYIAVSDLKSNAGGACALIPSEIAFCVP